MVAHMPRSSQDGGTVAGILTQTAATRLDERRTTMARRHATGHDEAVSSPVGSASLLKLDKRDTADMVTLPRRRAGY
jgi:hypothetical protein